MRIYPVRQLTCNEVPVAVSGQSPVRGTALGGSVVYNFKHKTLHGSYHPVRRADPSRSSLSWAFQTVKCNPIDLAVLERILYRVGPYRSYRNMRIKQASARGHVTCARDTTPSLE